MPADEDNSQYLGFLLSNCALNIAVNMQARSQRLSTSNGHATTATTACRRGDSHPQPQRSSPPTCLVALESCHPYRPRSPRPTTARISLRFSLSSLRSTAPTHLNVFTLSPLGSMEPTLLPQVVCARCALAGCTRQPWRPCNPSMWPRLRFFRRSRPRPPCPSAAAPPNNTAHERCNTSPHQSNYRRYSTSTSYISGATIAAATAKALSRVDAGANRDGHDGTFDHPKYTAPLVPASISREHRNCGSFN